MLETRTFGTCSGNLMPLLPRAPGYVGHGKLKPLRKQLCPCTGRLDVVSDKHSPGCMYYQGDLFINN
jgi:hypothetical protein